MIKYKLTTQECMTRGNTYWEIGTTNYADGNGVRLCSPGVLHYYDGPLTAILMNPIHANIPNPRLFEIECDSVAHDGVKGGSKWQRPVRELDVPKPTTTTRVAFGILCALGVYSEPGFVRWGQGWLYGGDRTMAAARAAYAANAYAATYAAANAAAAYANAAAAYATATAADANAAYATANAAYATAAAADATATAADAIDAAAHADAYAAAHAATYATAAYAAAARGALDLEILAEQAFEIGARP